MGARAERRDAARDARHRSAWGTPHRCNPRGPTAGRRRPPRAGHRRADPATGDPIPNATYRESNGLRLVVSGLSALDGKFAAQGITSGDVVRSIAATARRFKTRKVFGDQFSQFALAESFARNGLAYLDIAWTNELKVQAVTHLRTWLRDRTLIISPDAETEKLKIELLRFEERLAPSGYTTYAARRSGHDDRATLLLLAAAIDVTGAFSGSPSGIDKRRFETR